MLRKCSLVGLVTFVDRGSLYQLMFGILVTLSFLIMNARADPYVKLFQSNFKVAVDTARSSPFFRSPCLFNNATGQSRVTLPPRPEQL